MRKGPPPAPGTGEQAAPEAREAAARAPAPRRSQGCPLSPRRRRLRGEIPRTIAIRINGSSAGRRPGRRGAGGNTGRRAPDSTWRTDRSWLPLWTGGRSISIPRRGPRRRVIGWPAGAGILEGRWPRSASGRQRGPTCRGLPRSPVLPGVSGPNCAAGSSGVTGTAGTGRGGLVTGVESWGTVRGDVYCGGGA